MSQVFDHGSAKLVHLLINGPLNLGEGGLRMRPTPFLHGLSRLMVSLLPLLIHFFLAHILSLSALMLLLFLTIPFLSVCKKMNYTREIKIVSLVSPWIWLVSLLYLFPMFYPLVPALSLFLVDRSLARLFAALAELVKTSLRT